MKNKGNGKQTMLAAIFMVVMLLGFGSIAYISKSYTVNGEYEALYITDSDTEFGAIEYPSTNAYPSLNTCQRGSIGAERFQHNRTPVYQGNNSWVISINSTGYISNTGLFVINLPNTENWIIKNIVVNMTKNTDADIRVYGKLTSYSTNLVSEQIYNIFYDDTSAHTVVGTTYNKNISIPLNTAINIQNNANNKKNTILELAYDDTLDDGIGAFAWELKIEVFGERIADWSINDTIFGALAGATALNILCAVYMTDAIDVGGFSKALKSKRRR